MSEIINTYRCEHSFDRTTCAFCSPQASAASDAPQHFGGYLMPWDMDDDNPLMGELPSQEEIAVRKMKEKEAKEVAKQRAKEMKQAELQKDIFGDEQVDTEQELINKLPF